MDGRRKGENISDRSAAQKQGMITLRRESADEVALRLAVRDAIFWRNEAIRQGLLCAALRERLPGLDMHLIESQIERTLKSEAA